MGSNSSSQNTKTNMETGSTSHVVWAKTNNEKPLLKFCWDKWKYFATTSLKDYPENTRREDQYISPVTEHWAEIKWF